MVVEGELLFVQDSSVVVMTPRVVIVGFRDMRQLTFASFRWPQRVDRRLPSGAAMDRARSVSRFPFGIPETALSELLHAAGQSAPDTLRSAR